MSWYTIDRARLEENSTEEILRILKEDREDYTSEAIRTFEEILKARGVSRTDPAGVARPRASAAASSDDQLSGDALVRGPGDAVRVLNDLLQGVLKGTVDVQVAQTATNIVLATLRALEMEFMTEPEETS